MARNVTVRAATSEDLSGILGVLDAAALETDAERVRASIARDDALVAVRRGAEGTVLGALVLVSPDSPRGDVAHIDAVAVRRRRRDQGIGRALVRAAADRYNRLAAEFGPGVCPFYESLGFRVEPTGNGTDRLRGVRAAEGGGTERGGDSD